MLIHFVIGFVVFGFSISAAQLQSVDDPESNLPLRFTRPGTGEDGNSRDAVFIKEGVAAQKFVGPSTTTTYKPRWHSRPKCMVSKSLSQKLCVFSNPSFANGRGISIFTTKPQSKLFLELPAFTNVGLDGVDNETRRPQPYVIQDVAGHGFGVVANTSIFRGDVIMQESPVLMIHHETNHMFNSQEIERIEQFAFSQLPESTQAEVLRLSNSSGTGTDPSDSHIITSPIVSIAWTNSFRVGLFEIPSLGIGTPYNVLVPGISRLNHDCRPNAYYHFDPQTLRHVVVAARQIVPGEEVTISYIPQLQKREERMKQLRGWGFECDCSQCRATPEVSHASDWRIKDVLDIRNHLRDYPASQNDIDDDYKPNPRMAEHLITLYKQERLWGPINEAYMLAALEWNALGNEAKALEFAHLALESGLLYRGPGHFEVRRVEEFLQSPTTHPSWRKGVNETDVTSTKG